MDYFALFIPMLTLIIAQAFIWDLARFRFSRKKLVVIIFIEFAIILAISGSILLFTGLEVYASWYVIIIVVPAMGTFIYTSKRRDARDVFTILTTIIISNIISIPAMWVSQFYENSYLFYNLVRIAIFIILFIIVHTFFRNPYRFIQDQMDKGWWVFCLLPLIGTIVIYYSFLRYGQNGNFKEVIYVGSATIFFMVNAYVLIFYMFWQLHEKYIGQEQRRILTIQNRAQLEQHILFKEAAEKSNRRWHDLRHTNHALIHLLERGETASAIEYLKEQMNLNTIHKEKYCQHPDVNTILCLWAERCRNEGVFMKIMVRMPEKLDIDPMELSALFANAIENAFHACLALPADVNRYIKVEALYNGKRLSIGITNTCKDDVMFENGIPISQQEGGGIGTQSMIYTVKRFHGAYTFKAHEGLFFTRLVLNV